MEPRVSPARPLCSTCSALVVLTGWSVHGASAVLLRALIPESRRWLRVLTPDLRLKASLCPDSRPGPRCFPPRITGCDGVPVVLYAPAPPVLPPGPKSRKAPSLHSLLPPPGPSCHPAPPDTQTFGKRLCPCVHSPDRLSTCSDYTVLCLDGCPGKAGALRMVALMWFVSWSPTSHQHCSGLLGI